MHVRGILAACCIALAVSVLTTRASASATSTGASTTDVHRSGAAIVVAEGLSPRTTLRRQSLGRTPIGGARIPALKGRSTGIGTTRPGRRVAPSLGNSRFSIDRRRIELRGPDATTGQTKSLRNRLTNDKNRTRAPDKIERTRKTAPSRLTRTRKTVKPHVRKAGAPSNATIARMPTTPADGGTSASGPVWFLGGTFSTSEAPPRGPDTVIWRNGPGSPATVHARWQPITLKRGVTADATWTFDNAWPVKITGPQPGSGGTATNPGRMQWSDITLERGTTGVSTWKLVGALPTKGIGSHFSSDGVPPRAWDITLKKGYIGPDEVNNDPGARLTSDAGGSKPGRGIEPTGVEFGNLKVHVPMVPKRGSDPVIVLRDDVPKPTHPGHTPEIADLSPGDPGQSKSKGGHLTTASPTTGMRPHFQPDGVPLRARSDIALKKGDVTDDVSIDDPGHRLKSDADGTAFIPGGSVVSSAVSALRQVESSGHASSDAVTKIPGAPGAAAAPGGANQIVLDDAKGSSGADVAVEELEIAHQGFVRFGDGANGRRAAGKKATEAAPANADTSSTIDVEEVTIVYESIERTQNHANGRGPATDGGLVQAVPEDILGQPSANADASSGFPSGKRQHRPVLVGQSSPTTIGGVRAEAIAGSKAETAGETRNTSVAGLRSDGELVQGASDSGSGQTSWGSDDFSARSGASSANRPTIPRDRTLMSYRHFDNPLVGSSGPSANHDLQRNQTDLAFVRERAQGGPPSAGASGDDQSSVWLRTAQPNTTGSSAEDDARTTSRFSNYRPQFYFRSLGSIAGARRFASVSPDLPEVIVRGWDPAKKKAIIGKADGAYLITSVAHSAADGDGVTDRRTGNILLSAHEATHVVQDGPVSLPFPNLSVADPDSTWSNNGKPLLIIAEDIEGEPLGASAAPSGFQIISAGKDREFGPRRSGSPPSAATGLANADDGRTEALPKMLEGAPKGLNFDSAPRRVVRVYFRWSK